MRTVVVVPSTSAAMYDGALVAGISSQVSSWPLIPLRIVSGLASWPGVKTEVEP